MTPIRSPIHPLVRARVWVLLVVLLACGALLPGIGRLTHDDDVLAFLPPEHPDVLTFGRVAERFGMLSVGLVGLSADDESLLVPERTERVRTLARRLAELEGVRLVLSYPDLPDAQVRDDVLIVDLLVPTETRDAAVLSARVLANPNAVGNLIAHDGRAAALLVYLDDRATGVKRQAQLAAIRSRTAELWPHRAYFGGAPFIEDAAAQASRDDIEGLSPIVIVVLAVASAVLLRSVVGAALNLLVTGLGVGGVVGAHAVFGEPFSIVSSTMPVLMVALGGAFGMHIIAGYQRQVGAPPERASAALRELATPVLLSGATTAVAFFALVVMPQEPMRRFGVAAGGGVLVLLLLSLVVLPGWLAWLPARALPPRQTQGWAPRRAPPLWLLIALAALGAWGASRWDADADPRHVFDPSSEPAQADRFFAAHFGGSQFIQIAVATDLGEPAALRRIRTLVTEVAAVPGVVDVRSLLEPIALLTEGFGGRRGIPETPERARRVLSQLADQPPMAQLMTTDGRNAMLHVKLSDASPASMQATVRAIVERIEPWRDKPLRVGPATRAEVGAAQQKATFDELEARTGRDLSDDARAALDRDAVAVPPEILRTIRDRALGTDEVIAPLDAASVAAVDPSAWAGQSVASLRETLRTDVPALAASDPEGLEILAEQIPVWIDEAEAVARGKMLCVALGIDVDALRCTEVQAIASERHDAMWELPEGTDTSGAADVPWVVEVTGQPIVGMAFAESVTESVWMSTAVSAVVLVVLLAVVGQARAIVPALWTLLVSTGLIAAAGFPISVATSMVTCVSLGAGVDFAIHLGVRARESEGSGAAAVAALGGVVLMTGLELGLAFSVLQASSMPPLRQFGVGLALSLMVAAFGAVGWAPILYRGLRPGSMRHA